jgi:hypothetical protein
MSRPVGEVLQAVGSRPRRQVSGPANEYVPIGQREGSLGRSVVGGRLGRRPSSRDRATWSYSLLADCSKAQSSRPLYANFVGSVSGVVRTAGGSSRMRPRKTKMKRDASGRRKFLKWTAAGLSVLVQWVGQWSFDKGLDKLVALLGSAPPAPIEKNVADSVSVGLNDSALKAAVTFKAEVIRAASFRSRPTTSA